MGSHLSLIFADIYMHYIEKNSFPFWTRYVNDTITLIDTFLHNVDHILQIMNSVDNNIQFTYEIEITTYFFFSAHLFSAPKKVSQHQFTVDTLLFSCLHTAVLAIHLVKKWLLFTLLLIAL